MRPRVPPRRRRPSRRVRRRRAVAAGLAACVAAALVAWAATQGGAGPGAAPGAATGPTGSTGSTGSTGAGPQPTAGGTAAGATLAVRTTATMPVSLSRAVVVGAGQGRLLVVGGLTATDTSSSAVSALDPATGALSTVGSLAAPTHDAGGALLGGRVLVFGGGQATSVATVEAVPVGPPGGATVGGQVVGRLPTPRSDDAAVVAGATAYVVGGYDGAAGAAAVLATTDGVHFRVVADLPVPVRYAGVAALAGRIYVFGGEAVGGAGAGQPVDLVQEVDPAQHRAHVVGHLPAAVQGAAAVDLGGHLYVAGGDTAATPRAAPVPAAVTLPSVWAYDPATGSTSVAGRLAAPVSYAGVVVQGSTAWLVGGETGGTVEGVVQRLTVSGAPG